MNHFIYRKKRKILLAAISMGVLAASISAFHGPEAVYAYTATAGTINDGPVKVRNARWRHCRTTMSRCSES